MKYSEKSIDFGLTSGLRFKKHGNATKWVGKKWNLNISFSIRHVTRFENTEICTENIWILPDNIIKYEKCMRKIKGLFDGLGFKYELVGTFYWEYM